MIAVIVVFLFVAFWYFVFANYNNLVEDRLYRSGLKRDVCPGCNEVFYRPTEEDSTDCHACLKEGRSTILRRKADEQLRQIRKFSR